MRLGQCVMAENAGATTGTEEITTEGPEQQVHDSGHAAVVLVRATERQSELGPVGCAEMAERRFRDESVTMSSWLQL